MVVDPENLRDFARRYTAAWCSRDAASVASFFAPNGSLRVNDDDPAVGGEAITEVAHADGFIAESLGHFDRAEYRRQLDGSE